MSKDTSAFGFGQFIPGFDFLQGLTRAGKEASAAPLSSWVAPTVSVEEISKRIEELKAVQFWLEQNTRALAATVQALEVQKMTLSTLQGMNVSMADLAKSFTGQASAGHADWPMSSKPAEAPAAAEAKAQTPPPRDEAQDTDPSARAGAGDPMQWWGALTQQFQQIAAQALQDPAQQQAMVQAAHMATDFTKAAMKAAGDIVRNATEAAQTAVVKPAAAETPAPAPRTSAAAPRRAAAASGTGPTAAKKTARKTPAKSTAKSPVARKAKP